MNIYLSENEEKITSKYCIPTGLKYHNRVHEQALVCWLESLQVWHNDIDHCCNGKDSSFRSNYNNFKYIEMFNNF